MNLAYAVDRLYDGGWTPSTQQEIETLPDGRTYPSVLAIQLEFARAGLELVIKHNLMFSCYRAVPFFAKPLDLRRLLTFLHDTQGPVRGSRTEVQA